MLRDYATFLKSVGAVDGNRAYPWCVYVSEGTTKTLRKNTRNEYKKEVPLLTKKGLDYAVSLDALNLEPMKSKAIKDGFAVIIDEAIK